MFTASDWAYTPALKIGPMRATILEARGDQARVRVTWEPTAVVTERVVPFHRLRRWEPTDDAYWQRCKDASAARRIADRYRAF